MTANIDIFSKLGPATGKMDIRGRMVLPSKYLSRLKATGDFGSSNPLVYLTIAKGGCLVAYPEEQWEEHKETLEKRAQEGSEDSEDAQRARLVIGAAHPIELDNANRIKVEDSLRYFAKMQTVDSKPVAVTFVGHSNRFEIWESAKYQEYLYTKFA